MKKFFKDNWKDVIKISIVIIIASYVAVVFSSWLQTDPAQEKIKNLGFWGQVVTMLYVASSHVVAPLAGTPGVVVALSAYGLFKGWLIVYLGSLLSATINFYIARIFGRKWVIRLAGKKSISKIDKFVTIMGTRVLIIARLFGFPLYEFISYAVGFTNMSFKKYFLITALVSQIPGTIITLFFYYSLSSPIALSFLLGSLILAGGLFGLYTIQLYKKTNK